MSIIGTSVQEMSDYWRPSISANKKEEIEKFIEEHPEMPFNNPRDFIDFAINKVIYEVQTGITDRKQQKEELRKLIEDL